MAITKEYLDSIRFDIAKQKYYNCLLYTSDAADD